MEGASKQEEKNCSGQIAWVEKLYLYLLIKPFRPSDPTAVLFTSKIPICLGDIYPDFVIKLLVSRCVGASGEGTTCERRNLKGGLKDFRSLASQRYRK